MTDKRNNREWIAGGLCAILMAGCVPAIPPDMIAAIEAIDRDLIAMGAPRAAPQEYAYFARQWISLKARVEADDALIRWPWESSDIEEELRRLHVEGGSTVARLSDRQVTQRRTAESTLARLEERFLSMASQVESFDGRVALGAKPVQTDLLIKQARFFLEQKDYARSIETAEQAAHALRIQTAILTRELERYADRRAQRQLPRKAAHDLTTAAIHSNGYTSS